MVDRIVLGKWGEDLAVRHLQVAGYQVVERNWRCRSGEIDIICKAPGLVVFVEVKTRSGDGFGEPASAVTPAKAHRLRGLAAQWLHQTRPGGWNDVRFDIVSIVRRPGQLPELDHLEGCF
jgi:putative endonuclease